MPKASKKKVTRKRAASPKPTPQKNHKKEQAREGKNIAKALFYISLTGLALTLLIAILLNPNYQSLFWVGIFSFAFVAGTLGFAVVQEIRKEVIQDTLEHPNMKRPVWHKQLFLAFCSVLIILSQLALQAQTIQLSIEGIILWNTIFYVSVVSAVGTLINLLQERTLRKHSK